MGHGHGDPRERIGTTLAGKYTLTRLLGVGGMGAVYAGTNTWTEREVAIKLMLTASGAIDPELGQRFMREARAATKIAHENIVQILDRGQAPAEGALLIVQEFLSGPEVRDVLDERGGVAPKETLEILAPVMAALVAAHK
ncbi:MAG: protein kinase, partial [Deltaproteobacteria bacterium]